MRVKLTTLLIVIMTAATIWYLPGCKQEQPADTTAQEEAVEAAEGDQDAEAPAGESLAERDEAAGKRLGAGDVENLQGILVAGKGELRDEAVRILRESLMTAEDPDARSAACRALQASPDDAIRELVHVANHDSEPEVRVAAADCLQYASPSEWLYGELEKLRQADDATIRAKAARALMSLHIKEKDRDKSLRWLVGQLGKRADDVSAQAAIELKIRGRQTLPYLIEALETSKDATQREVAASLIGLICAGTSPRQEEFAKLVKTQYKSELEQPGPVNLDGLRPLERAVAEDPEPEVRAVAAQGLGYLGQESSAAVLGKALHDEAEVVRWWAALALVGVPAQTAAADLARAATNDRSERVRRAAVSALGWLEPTDEVVYALARATYDTSPDVRRAAATELGRIADPKSAPALVRLFGDHDEEVRWAAVVAVGELKDPDTIGSLSEAMRDPSPMVANAAERALQKLGIAQRRYGTRGEL